MSNERTSAWVGANHGGAIRDVLAGKEHILLPIEVRRYPCRSLSACHFAALNFVRVAFKHLRLARGNPSPTTVQWLNTIMGRYVFEEILAPCQQLTSERVVQLEEMHHIPLFRNAFVHVATKCCHPSMILFKQSLRQMQLHASPVSAMIVSRSASATVCLKIREGIRDVFLILNFAVAPLENGHSRGTALALVASTSLQQTAARLSGILPMDNHLLTRDRQWQAQLFANCTICTFVPAEGAVLLSEAESSVVNESTMLLSIMGEIDDQGQDWERASDTIKNQGHREPWQRTPCNLNRTTAIRRRPAGPRSSGEGSSARTTDPRRMTTFIPYKGSGLHCRTFFPDQGNPSPFSSKEYDEPASFECMICFEIIPEEEEIRLLPCAHGFCRDCLAGHVCSKIGERKFPVLCPLCMVEQRNTSPSVVSSALVQRLGVSEAHYTIWSELELAHLCVRVHCRRCKRSALVDKEDYEQQDELRCPLPGCGHTWCKNCQRSISSGGPKHSCDGTEELDYLVKKMGWKNCPSCRTPVQKNGGCNHITCVSPGCNTHFCYRCGTQITRASIPSLVTSAVREHFRQCEL